MKRALCLFLLILLLLCSCAEKGRIEVLTKLEWDESQEETRRIVEQAPQSETSGIDLDAEIAFVINKKSGKFHADAQCSYVKKMLEENKQTVVATAQTLINEGKSPCSRCAKAYLMLVPSETEGDQ